MSALDAAYRELEEAFISALRPASPIRAYLGYAFGGTFTIRATNDDARVYVRFLDNTYATALHKGLLDIDAISASADRDKVIVTLTADATGQLSITGLDSAVESEIVSSIPDIYGYVPPP